MLYFNFEDRTKKVLVKTKPYNRQTVIPINQLFHGHMSPALAATDTIRYDTIEEFNGTQKLSISLQLNLAHVARN